MENGATNLGRMCLAMDANRALSQLSYRPKSALFMRKKLRILDFSNIRFSGESPTNRTGKRETKNRVGCVSLWMRTLRSTTLDGYSGPKTPRISQLFNEKKLNLSDDVMWSPPKWESYLYSCFIVYLSSRCKSSA